MSVFKEQCFLFLRNPRGGVEDLQTMRDAGFGGVFCNIGDYPVEAWEEIVLPRARSLGMFCGPWARTGQEVFDPAIVEKIVACADKWSQPLIVNSEAEINWTGSEATEYIADAIGDRDGAVSMQCWPFDSVDWTPLADIPVLPQIFPAESNAATDPEGCKWKWHERGVKCVFNTYGTYAGQTPDLYNLQAPYSLYTADDCGNVFAPWSPTSTGFPGCQEVEPVPPDGGDMEKIGSQHGVTAAMNRLRTLDPAGTLLVADSYTGKWPPLSSIEDVPLDQWKAFDKLERSLSILVTDHDEAMVFDVAD